MTAIGRVMMLIFGHIAGLFVPGSDAVSAGDWPAGAVAMARIRLLVLVNLVLVPVTTALVFLGRGWT